MYGPPSCLGGSDCGWNSCQVSSRNWTQVSHWTCTYLQLVEVEVTAAGIVVKSIITSQVLSGKINLILITATASVACCPITENCGFSSKVWDIVISHCLLPNVFCLSFQVPLLALNHRKIWTCLCSPCPIEKKSIFDTVCWKFVLNI